MGNIINGYEIALSIKNDIKMEIAKLSKKPCLAVIILGQDPSSLIYIKNKIIACEYVGISSNLISLPFDTSTEHLISIIKSLNFDSNINGILVQLPLPPHIDTFTILNEISKEKDVDCFNPFNTGLLQTKNPIFKPCTPSGCIELIKKSNISLSGKNCLIIGRSHIVGRPLASLLLNEDATVFIAHSKTSSLSSISLNADIIFVAVGIPKFLKATMIKQNSTIIDIGINRLEDGSICGDCDFDNCLKKASFITPVPKGVGPMTITMLLKNCLKAFYIQNNLLKI